MKIKKHISFILAFFILVSSIGLAFNVHYCGGKVASIEPTYFKLDTNSIKQDCCEKKVIKKNSCCKNKIFHFQKKSDNTILKAFSFNADVIFLKEVYENVVLPPVFNNTKTTATSYFFKANSPPFFKLFHQYIFYD